jgi:methionine-rich copper-binding protein CopC
MNKLILLFSALALGTLPAGAHAFLDHAEPRVGSTVAAPSQVKIWFTEELEGAFSTIQVFDASGKEVASGQTKVDPAHKTIMTVALPHLPPGEYKVKWSAVATDTHHTAGTFGFKIAP